MGHYLTNPALSPRQIPGYANGSDTWYDWNQQRVPHHGASYWEVPCTRQNQVRYFRWTYMTFTLVQNTTWVRDITYSTVSSKLSSKNHKQSTGAEAERVCTLVSWNSHDKICDWNVFHQSLDDLSECGAEPLPGAVNDKVGRVGDERCVMCVELARLVWRTSPLPAWTHESGVCRVSCALSWHVLSEGR